MSRIDDLLLYKRICESAYNRKVFILTRSEYNDVYIRTFISSAGILIKGIFKKYNEIIENTKNNNIYALSFDNCLFTRVFKTLFAYYLPYFLKLLSYLVKNYFKNKMNENEFLYLQICKKNNELPFILVIKFYTIKKNNKSMIQIIDLRYNLSSFYSYYYSSMKISL